MSYTVKSSEKTKKTGSDYETKALLYLMNFRSDSDEIHYFVVDFFNDLTGMDRMASDLWDLQSKGAKNVSPKVIGQELVTLFKNYLSDIEFKTYILFMGGVSDSIHRIQWQFLMLECKHLIHTHVLYMNVMPRYSFF